MTSALVLLVFFLFTISQHCLHSVVSLGTSLSSRDRQVGEILQCNLAVFYYENHRDEQFIHDNGD